MNKTAKLYKFVDEKIDSYFDERITSNKKLSKISKFVIAILTEGAEITVEFLENLFGSGESKYSIEELQELCLISVKNNKITLLGRNTSEKDKYKLFKKAYYKLLKNEKWKNYKKDEKCALCGSTENLQLHHTFYVKDAFIKPWDYPKDSIVTLCSKCHMNVHFNKKHQLHEQTLLRKEAEKIYKIIL